jgi:hypothetical protein
MSARCECLPDDIGTFATVDTDPILTNMPSPPSGSDELASWVIPVAVVAGICVLLTLGAVLVYCIIIRKSTNNTTHVDPYGGQSMQLYSPQPVAQPMFPSWEQENQQRMSNTGSFQGAPILHQSYTELRGSSGSNGTMVMSTQSYAGGMNTTGTGSSSYNSATSPQQLQPRPANYAGYGGANNQNGASFGEKAAF